MANAHRSIPRGSIAQENNGIDARRRGTSTEGRQAAARIWRVGNRGLGRRGGREGAVEARARGGGGWPAVAWPHPRGARAARWQQR
eukprot:6140363-Pyramimonas_sp.AAC.1